ncbi:NPP1 family protein [Bacillus wiedmannii]|uniref:NPP1 family protein n=1 Tax=Bacillus wiedmannii TaxID=1890302 RepID=UPI003D2314B6
MNQNIAAVREAVNALFSNHTLQLKVTDYHVDQVAKLVECISDQNHSKEKMCLLDQVKLAKRLSRERNLLNYGDFESSNWAGADGWNISAHVYTIADNLIFKDHYLNMPSVNNPILSDKIFPTYAYQKIEESKLKPYTRYMVRGFVGSSKDLEILVARHGKEVHKRMNVPNDIIPTNPCTGELVSQPPPYPVMPIHTMAQNMWCNPCENGYQTAAGMMVQETNMVCQDPHEFKFSIDIGEIDRERNLGIWIGFKVGTTEGMATLDSIEVVEVGPLTGDALKRMQKREQKWKKKWAEKQMKIERAVQIARNAIQTLFTDPNQNRLQSAITLKNIVDAEKWVQKIPYVYNQFLQGAIPEVPGEQYNVFQQLSQAVVTARGLYNQRNVINNGDFSAGLSNWNGTKGADVQQIGKESVLMISDWSANISQQVCVEPEHSYLLRVTARKEGSGEGYVTISDGTKDNTETLKFIVGEETTGATMSTIRSHIRERYNERNMVTSEVYDASGYASNQNMVNYSSENYGMSAYSGNNNKNYQSESFGFTPYGDENSMMNYPSENYGENAYSGNDNMNYPSNNYEMNPYSSDMNMSMNQGSDCRCGCSTNSYPGGDMTMNNYPSSMYETNAYPSSTNMTDNLGMGCGCYYSTNEHPMVEQSTLDLSDYVMKTVEIFPETNRVCIEIGETAGIFMIESIEFVPVNPIESVPEPGPGIYQSVTALNNSSVVEMASQGARNVIKALPQNASNIELEYAPVYDYDTDGCYATAAISPDGTTNPGLGMGDSPSSGCRGPAQLENSNTYSRAKSNNGWTAIMYASYFEKDQTSLGPGSAGHRHDWEHTIVWVKDGQVQYVTYSAHGNWYTNPRSNVRFSGNHPKIVYHKDSISTHAFRLANSNDEPPENYYHQWLLLPIVGWYGYPSRAIREKLMTTNFGSATIEIKDGNFERALEKAKPPINFDPYAPELEDGGAYQIVSTLNNRSVVDMDPPSKNVHLWENGNANNQKWKLVYDSIKSAYQMKNIANENLVLTWNDLNGSINVIATSNQNQEEQYWIPTEAGNGYYYVRNKKDPNKVLDVSGYGTANGTNVTVYNVHGGNNQKFKLSNVTGILTREVESLYKAQPGQSSRSSNNFSLEHLAAGTKVRVILAGEGATSLSFNISRDKSGTDSSIWSNVRDSSVLTIPSGDDRKNLYISGPPSGYTSNGTFTVKFYAL